MKLLVAGLLLYDVKLVVIIEEGAGQRQADTLNCIAALITTVDTCRSVLQSSQKVIDSGQKETASNF
jgi:hypothetical protein